MRQAFLMKKESLYGDRSTLLRSAARIRWPMFRSFMEIRKPFRLDGRLAVIRFANYTEHRRHLSSATNTVFQDPFDAYSRFISVLLPTTGSLMKAGPAGISGQERLNRHPGPESAMSVSERAEAGVCPERPGHGESSVPLPSWMRIPVTEGALCDVPFPRTGFRRVESAAGGTSESAGPEEYPTLLEPPSYMCMIFTIHFNRLVKHCILFD
jgi:hypothetical protein